MTPRHAMELEPYLEKSVAAEVVFYPTHLKIIFFFELTDVPGKFRSNGTRQVRQVDRASNTVWKTFEAEEQVNKRTD